MKKKSPCINNNTLWKESSLIDYSGEQNKSIVIMKYTEGNFIA